MSQYLRVHCVLSRLAVHPVLHDVHLAAPSTGHSTPVFATPFWHAHELSANAQHKRTCSRQYFIGDRHVKKDTLTNALRPGIIDCPSGFA